MERFLLRCLTDALIVGGSHTWVEGWTDAMWGMSPHSGGLWPLSGLAPCLSQRGFMPITVAKYFLVSVSWCPICFLGSGSVSLCPCPPSPPGPLAGLQTLRLTSDPLVDLPCPQAFLPGPLAGLQILRLTSQTLLLASIPLVFFHFSQWENC